jgi:hypothetical protein
VTAPRTRSPTTTRRWPCATAETAKTPIWRSLTFPKTPTQPQENPMTFAKATKKQAKLRLCLQGASGCGKTYTALSIATKLGEKVAVLDTEHGSASLYADAFAFDTCEVIGGLQSPALHRHDRGRG